MLIFPSWRRHDRNAPFRLGGPANVTPNQALRKGANDAHICFEKDGDSSIFPEGAGEISEVSTDNPDLLILSGPYFPRSKQGVFAVIHYWRFQHNLRMDDRDLLLHGSVGVHPGKDS